jgi:phage shock protein C
MSKIYRSRTDSKLFGLCGGLAQLINVDSTLLRVIVVVTAFFSGGTVIPLYFIACLVIPKEPAFDFPGPESHGPYYGPSSTRNTGYYGSQSNTGYYNSSTGSHSTGFQPGATNQQGYNPQRSQDYRGQGPQGFNAQGSQGFNAQGFQSAQGPAGSGTQGVQGAQGYAPGSNPSGQPVPSQESTVDEMMRDMEKKMLQREIDELRAKVAQYEQKNRQDGSNEQK